MKGKFIILITLQSPINISISIFILIPIISITHSDISLPCVAIAAFYSFDSHLMIPAAIGGQEVPFISHSRNHHQMIIWSVFLLCMFTLKLFVYFDINFQYGNTEKYTYKEMRNCLPHKPHTDWLDVGSTVTVKIVLLFFNKISFRQFNHRLIFYQKSFLL